MPDRPVRERDRYGRASWRERAGDTLRSLRRSPGLVAVLVIMVGGWAVLMLTLPSYVRVEELAAGDCIYIHAADANTDLAGGRPAGSSGAALTALYREGAERTGCDASHGHEVMATFTFPEPAGAGYPGPGVLAERQEAACGDAFTAWVGREPEGSELEPVVAIPDREAWETGVRAGACLVGRRDGQFLPASARGSGR